MLTLAAEETALFFFDLRDVGAGAEASPSSTSSTATAARLLFPRPLAAGVFLGAGFEGFAFLEVAFLFGLTAFFGSAAGCARRVLVFLF